MDHFFTHFGTGETDVDLHCDNCTGQNKNNFVLWYGAWQVGHKHHSTLNIHFRIASHIKFVPDCGFGLIKQAYKRTRVNTLANIAKSTGTGKQLSRMSPQRPIAGQAGRWHSDGQAFD
ncbi:hypothetical protein ILYODFUR_036530 [Ilyodon furcidens]|uniref:DUF7869 domain-containing protein n=1 Tax=Ilyodon furcidens TaxID=33524 RepID=A0ABV0UE41_9TELE